MKRPDSIKISYFDYPIVRSPAGNMVGIDGSFQRDTRLVVEAGMKPAREAYVLLHEVCHGIYSHWCMSNGSLTEERIVDSMANGLSTVLHDNPVFAAWLTKALR